MAQTRRRRRRKHRGTQGGSIDRRGRAGRPRSRQEARARAKRQMQDRRDVRPTWTGSIPLALLIAATFFVLLIALFKQSLTQALGPTVFMAIVYVPMNYYTQLFVWRRRQARKQREREQR
jgi:Flp pilus assembly protein TadB